MSDEKQEIIIFPNRSKTLVLACGALIFVIVGVLFAIGRGEIISQLRGWGLSLNLANSVSFCVIIIVSYAGVAFFGFGFICLIYSFISPKPLFVINNKGIIVHRLFTVRVEEIKWGEIREVFTYEIAGHRVLGIIPKNNTTILSPKGVMRRMIIKVNEKKTQAPINIALDNLSISADELLLNIGKYYGAEVHNRTE